MAKTFLISDTHFGHSNILTFRRDNGTPLRDFPNIYYHDEHLIQQWNKTVSPLDKVYHLGDVYINASKGYIENILSSLNGKKRLILGNHDNGKDQILQKYFEKIMLWRNFDKFVLTHVPLREESIPGRNRINIHGHIHNNPSPEGPYVNVSVEQINYTPVNLDEIIGTR